MSKTQSKKNFPNTHFIIASATAFFKIPDTRVAENTNEQWRAIEIELTRSHIYPEPFFDVDVTARFTGPGGQIISRPVFGMVHKPGKFGLHTRKPGGKKDIKKGQHGD